MVGLGRSHTLLYSLLGLPQGMALTCYCPFSKLFGVLLWARAFLILLLLKANVDNIFYYKHLFLRHCMACGITGEPTVFLHKYNAKTRGIRWTRTLMTDSVQPSSALDSSLQVSSSTKGNLPAASEFTPWILLTGTESKKLIVNPCGLHWHGSTSSLSEHSQALGAIGEKDSSLPLNTWQKPQGRQVRVGVSQLFTMSCYLKWKLEEAFLHWGFIVY